LYQGVELASGQQQALQAGAKFSGCTVHFVDDTLDGGPIILQASVPIRDDDTVETLSERILKEEHRVYSQAIALVLSGRCEIHGGRVIFKNQKKDERLQNYSGEEQLERIRRGAVDIIVETELREKRGPKDGKTAARQSRLRSNRPDIHVGHTVLIRKTNIFGTITPVIFMIATSRDDGDPS
jgi:hypothetical protein